MSTAGYPQIMPQAPYSVTPPKPIYTQCSSSPTTSPTQAKPSNISSDFSRRSVQQQAPPHRYSPTTSHPEKYTELAPINHQPHHYPQIYPSSPLDRSAPNDQQEQAPSVGRQQHQYPPTPHDHSGKFSSQHYSQQQQHHHQQQQHHHHHHHHHHHQQLRHHQSLGQMQTQAVPNHQFPLSRSQSPSPGIIHASISSASSTASSSSTSPSTRQSSIYTHDEPKPAMMSFSRNDSIYSQPQQHRQQPTPQPSQNQHQPQQQQEDEVTARDIQQHSKQIAGLSITNASGVKVSLLNDGGEHDDQEHQSDQDQEILKEEHSQDSHRRRQAEGTVLDDDEEEAYRLVDLERQRQERYYEQEQIRHQQYQQQPPIPPQSQHPLQLQPIHPYQQSQQHLYPSLDDISVDPNRVLRRVMSDEDGLKVTNPTSESLASFRSRSMSGGPGGAKPAPFGYFARSYSEDQVTVDSGVENNGLEMETFRRMSHPVRGSPKMTNVPSTKRKYACLFKNCNKCFTTSGHLARHNRIHTGERNFMCRMEGCRSRFSRQDNMMQHFRTHISVKSRRGNPKKGEMPTIQAGGDTKHFLPNDEANKNADGRSASLDSAMLLMHCSTGNNKGQQQPPHHSAAGNPSNGHLYSNPSNNNSDLTLHEVNGISAPADRPATSLSSAPHNVNYANFHNAVALVLPPPPQSNHPEVHRESIRHDHSHWRVPRHSSPPKFSPFPRSHRSLHSGRERGEYIEPHQPPHSQHYNTTTSSSSSSSTNHNNSPYGHHHENNSTATLVPLPGQTGVNPEDGSHPPHEMQRKHSYEY